MPKRTATPKAATSVRLTEEAKELLALLAERNGISQAAWLETVIRREARREKIEAAAESKEGAG